MLFADRIGPRLAIGWTMRHTGFRAGRLSQPSSLDTPTGATIVVTFGGVLIVECFYCISFCTTVAAARELKGGVSAQRGARSRLPLLPGRVVFKTNNPSISSPAAPSAQNPIQRK